MWAKLSCRLFWQEAKRGELNLMLASIVLAVAAVFSLSLFSEQLRATLNEQSSQFLAADRVLSASRPIEDNLTIEANNNASGFDLRFSTQLRFSSMLLMK